MSKIKLFVKKNNENKKIARERIEILFNEAQQVFNANKILANRYVEMARTLSMKYKVPLSSEEKKQFCKHCYSYLVPSVNARVRVREKMIVIFCDNCKSFSRFRYKK